MPDDISGDGDVLVLFHDVNQQRSRSFLLKQINRNQTGSIVDSRTNRAKYEQSVGSHPRRSEHPRRL
jgi:hypothetical protein